MTSPIVLPDSNNLKRCGKCHEWLPFEAFSVCRSRADGRQSQCKTCHAQWYAAHSEYKRNYQREYRAEHREVELEKAKAKRRDNPEIYAEYNRRYIARHPEAKGKWKERNPERVAIHGMRYRQKVREIRAANPELCEERDRRAREYRRQYQKEHAELYRVCQSNRRALKKAAGGSYTPADIEAIRVAQGNHCYLCGKKLKKYHVDHFIPLTKGGTNDPGNLRLACPSCNVRKSAKHPFELGRLL